MRRIVATLAGVLALTVQPAPALAQQPPRDDMAGFAALMGGMFEAEPLTSEQQARLPAATALIERIIPPGTMGELMDGMMGGILGPLTQFGSDDPASAVAEVLGMATFDLNLTPEQAEEAALLLDPAWQERRRRQAEAMPAMMSQMMTAIEPAMKSAMAELYAIYFTEAELADIDAFFRTPSGAAYARKSFSMSADPRLAGAMMQAMPAMFEQVGAMEAQMAAATADLPARRSFDQLSKPQRARLAALTGLDEDALAQAMAQASEPSDHEH